METFVDDHHPLVAKLESTVALEGGDLKRTFQILACPGLTMVWIGRSVPLDECPSGYATVTQYYELRDGRRFRDDEGDLALAAWVETNRAEAALLEPLAQALKRFTHHGLRRPLWQHMTEPDRASWVHAARKFRNFLLGFGIGLHVIDGGRR